MARWISIPLDVGWFRDEEGNWRRVKDIGNTVLDAPSELAREAQEYSWGPAILDWNSKDAQ